MKRTHLVVVLILVAGAAFALLLGIRVSLIEVVLPPEASLHAELINHPRDPVAIDLFLQENPQLVGETEHFGFTPLMFVASEPSVSLDVLDVLLRHGADPLQPGASQSPYANETAIDIALEWDSIEVLRRMWETLDAAQREASGVSDRVEQRLLD